MAIKQIKKNPQQIKKEILSHLELQPLSVEQLRKKIKDSNWSTINKYLEELKKGELIREIVSTTKIKIYQRIMGDTYFDIPITEEQRKKFHTLFHMIFEEYKKQNKIPTKTHVSKCAVYVIDNKESELKDLPIVWYLYGMMPLMAIDITEKYQKEKTFNQEKKVQQLIREFINGNKNKKSSEIQKEQHRKYKEDMYVIMDNILEILNKPRFENKELNKKLDEFFIACPANDPIEIFDAVDKVISKIQKLDLMKVKLQDYRKQIFQLLDALWKIVAIHQLSKSVLQQNNLINKEILFEFYLNGAIEDRKRSLQESFLEMNSIYLNELARFDPESIILSDKAKDVARIMEDFI